MKRILFLVVAFFSVQLSFGQVVISQYIEACSGLTPKGIEIWNTSGVDIDLATNPITVQTQTNANSAWSNLEIINTGTLAAGEVIVIGAGMSINGSSCATLIADGFTFNGDDALRLQMGGSTVDMFGDPSTTDPGTSWSGSGVRTHDTNIELSAGITTGDIDGWTDPSTRFNTVNTDCTLTGFGIPPGGCPSATCAISNVTSSLVSCSNGIATVDVTFTYTTPGSSFAISGDNGFATISGQAYTGSPQTIQVTTTGNNAAQTFTITDADDSGCNATSSANMFDCPVATQLEYTSVPGSAVLNTPFDIEVCATNGSVTQTDYSTGITLTQTLGTAATVTPASPATPTNGCVTFTITPTAGDEDIAFNATSGALPTEASGNIAVSATPPGCGDLGGLLINEFSNGTTGSQEYIELVVLGAPGNPTAPVDLTGWIIDDNNGDFDDSDVDTQDGVAGGHIRLGSAYSAMTPGDIIVIYNNGDVNPLITTLGIDPTDANNDGVYVVPANHASIEAATSNSGCSTNTGTPTSQNFCNGNPSPSVPTYTGNTYTTEVNNAWSMIGYRNGGDAAQVRCPDFVLFHALTYGNNNPNGQNFAVHTGGGSGSGDVWSFSCNAMYNELAFDRTNASTDQTPGVVNSLSNDTLLMLITDGSIDYTQLRSTSGDFDCKSITLPIELLSFEAKATNNIVNLEWATASELNNDFFTIERSIDGLNFKAIETMDGAGNSNVILNYATIDKAPLFGVSYYRLKQTDFDGTFAYSAIKAVNFGKDAAVIVNNVYPNPTNGILNIDMLIANETTITATIIDIAGRTIFTKSAVAASGNSTLNVDVNDVAAGTYWLSITQNGVKTVERFVKK